MTFFIIQYLSNKIKRDKGFFYLGFILLDTYCTAPFDSIYNLNIFILAGILAVHKESNVASIKRATVDVLKHAPERAKS